ncbi:DMT family transporter, partial [Anaerospora hongkongensis]
PLVVTAYSHGLGAAGLVLLGLIANPVWTYSPDSLGINTLAVLLFSSFISTAIGAVLWNMGIQKVGATTASLFQNASPIVGVFASAFFLGEQLSWLHFAALSLVLVGVVFGTGLLRLPVRSA